MKLILRVFFFFKLNEKYKVESVPTAFSFHSPQYTWKINCSIFQGRLILWKCINYLPGRTLGGIPSKGFLLKETAVQTSYLTVTAKQYLNRQLHTKKCKLDPCDNWLIQYQKRQAKSTDTVCNRQGMTVIMFNFTE